MAFERNAVVSPVLFVITCGGTAELTSSILKRIDNFLRSRDLHTAGAHIAVVNPEGPLAGESQFEEYEDDVRGMLEKGKNVLLWIAPEISHTVEKAFFFEDVKEIQIGAEEKRRSSALHVAESKCKTLEGGTKAVLELLGRFAALPTCHRPLEESFEFGLQQKANAAKQKQIKKLADEGFASACAVCGGLACGSVQKYLAALPETQRQDVLQLMTDMQAEDGNVA
jgi:hypothetical protein